MCIFLIMFCLSFSLAGNKAQVEALLQMGINDGIWGRNWTPPGARTDLYSFLKDKLKNLRKREKEDEKMQSRYEEFLREKRAKLD